MSISARMTKAFADRFESTWMRTDALLGLVAADAILHRPISLRHPFIFYVGHLPAFAWNHICRGVLGQASFQPSFDEIFDRGIDPDVEDPTRVHAHPEVPDRWPDLADVHAYRDRVRRAVLDSLPDIEEHASEDVMARQGRVCSMVLEHELMHQETLLYMIQQLPPEHVGRPARAVPYAFGDGRRPETVEVPGGRVMLGADFDTLEFGWDNEFPSETRDVPAFAIDALPITNRQFQTFVDAGGYDRAELWSEADWKWRESWRQSHPTCWSRQSGAWRYRTLFEWIPLAQVGDWPVYVSLAEARAYARWAGGRLPTEAEFHRAAYGDPRGGERAYPWGEEPTTDRPGNADFGRWSPEPVGSRPDGVSAWGVHELIGNGWEWTDTPFAPFPGFEAYIARYPGYSADFFDGKHFVLKGGSWATGAPLTRRSFRNWYQGHYPYVFAKFRCTYELERTTRATINAG